LICGISTIMRVLKIVLHKVISLDSCNAYICDA
jgi:hypothetical protein